MTSGNGPPAGGEGTERDSGHDRSEAWKRGAFALFFLAAFSVAQALQTLIAVFQFVAILVTGRPNAYLADFGIGFAQWLAETSGFLTAVTERKPFPWAPWPRTRREEAE